jgi:hypothetical protein
VNRLLADRWWIMALAFLLAAASSGAIQAIAKDGGYYSEPPWPLSSVVTLVIAALMYLAWRGIIRGAIFCWLLAFSPKSIDRVLGPVER